MRCNTLAILCVLCFAVIGHGQTPAVYWGLDWTFTSAQVDSALSAVTVEKKSATKTLYSESRQIRGHVYRIEQKGIEKIYVWYHGPLTPNAPIHSIEIVYRFDFPYDAQRFTDAYKEKYGHGFRAEPRAYNAEDQTEVMLRTVEEPPVGKLGNSVYLVVLTSPLSHEDAETAPDFLF